MLKRVSKQKDLIINIIRRKEYSNLYLIMFEIIPILQENPIISLLKCIKVFKLCLKDLGCFLVPRTSLPAIAKK